MRFPVFGRGADPRKHRPLVRKSMVYLEEQVSSGVADWVDARDHKQGIVAREVLYFGPRAELAQPIDSSKLPALELPGLKFEPPKKTRPPYLPLLRNLSRPPIYSFANPEVPRVSSELT
jgi:hypothetical protein